MHLAALSQANSQTRQQLKEYSLIASHWMSQKKGEPSDWMGLCAKWVSLMQPRSPHSPEPTSSSEVLFVMMPTNMKTKI